MFPQHFHVCAYVVILSLLHVPATRPCYMSPQCVLHSFLSLQRVSATCPSNMTPLSDHLKNLVKKPIKFRCQYTSSVYVSSDFSKVTTVERLWPKNYSFCFVFVFCFLFFIIIIKQKEYRLYPENPSSIHNYEQNRWDIFVDLCYFSIPTIKCCLWSNVKTTIYCESLETELEDCRGIFFIGCFSSGTSYTYM